MAQQAMDVDLINRDPNGLNNHLACQFEDVFGEPEGIHSMDCVWRNSYKCFECSKGCCYKLLTTLCGICIAFYWGCEFAGIAFDHIWCLTPAYRDFAICIGYWRKVYQTLVDCCCGPCCETMGLCLSNIAIKRS